MRTLRRLTTCRRRPPTRPRTRSRRPTPALPLQRRWRRRRHGTGFTGAPGTQLLEALDHHLLAGLQAARARPIRPSCTSSRSCTGARRDLAVGADHQHAVARAPSASPPAAAASTAAGTAACSNAHAHVHARAAAGRSVLGTSARSVTWPDVGSTDRSREQQACPVRVSRCRLPARCALRRPRRCRLAQLVGRHRRLAQAQHLGGRLREVDVHRVDLLDQRQLRGFALRHQRAFGHQRRGRCARRSAP